MPTTKALSASKFFGKDRYEYYLNELLTQQKVGGNALSKSQIKEGFLKRKDKISFEKFVEKVISTKTAKSAIAPPEIKSSPVTNGVGLGSRGGGLVKSPTGALEKYVSGASKPQKMGGIEDDISKITKSVISIAEILSGQKKLKDSSTSYDRRKAEQEKRSLAESKLEKRFDGLKKAAEKILAPVKSLLDKIINFLVTVFLGRVVYKLLEWFGDPKNAGKVRAISRFLGDHWPKLLALYLTFGTSVGRFALGLTKIVAKGAIKLLAKILLLSKAKKLRAAGRFFGGKGGKIAGAVLGTAAVVGGAYALTQGMKGDDEEPKTLKPEEPKTPGYAGGGIIKIPAFKGGGFNFKGMFGGALGSSPEKPEEMPNGFVSGEKGVDKVPAMLTDGEFVMSTGAVRKYGVDTLEGMNAAGGGTNQPKIVSGTTYAAGGGMIGSNTDPDGVKENSPTQGGDDIRKVISLIKHVFGYDVNKPQNWGPPAPPSSPSSSGGNSGGGIAGTVQRRVEYEYNKRFGGGNQSSSGKQLRNDSTSGGIVGTIGSRMKYEYNKRFGGGNKPTPTKGKSGGNANGKNDKSNIIGGLGRQQYREAGMVYGRSLLGGIGGDLTERDFSPESQKILEQAIKRAESRKEQKIIKAQEELAKDPNNLQKKSALERLQKGQVRLEYGDYASKMEVAKDGTHKAIYTDKEDDLKNILGQAWFEKQKGGGYKSTNEKYDFQQYKNPLKVLLGMTGEENKEVKKSGVNFQKRLEAFHQILKGAGIAKDLNADVLIGGKRPSISNQSQYKASGMAKYSAANISRVQRSRVSPPTQPSRPAPKIVYGGSGAKSTFQNTGGNGRYGKPSVPSFSAVHPNSESRRRNAAVLGVR